jgi:hypothetical protein
LISSSMTVFSNLRLVTLRVIWFLVALTLL